ncbi:substrate-binding domain-containing protein [Pengzhenrongella frigida]|uniref:DeoR family transcriptional regulator n=1 Tax=Pengzhenrongella frigida TaxID=1259133 RepID=A0A4Q5N1X2_9MICO|nr:substrate-binding domain-containing protein [Cellulomonas sp. HLT2-17]RYV52110.1 DeoR family transcriptional regulator [Cellulomonas sp. HLT2-17]
MSTLDTRGPLPVTRRAQLLEALQRGGTVRVSELTDILGVTPVTVRRDIAQLASEGLVRRVHGGATLITPGEEAADVGPGAALSTVPLGLRSVGVFVPSLDYYWPEVLRGAEEEARIHGLRIVLGGSSYETDDDRPQLARLIEQSGVDGLVIAPRMEATTAPEMIAWLASTGVPVVLVERSATVGPHHAAMESVVSDHALGAAMAVRHLASLGHRKIGLVLSRQSPTGPHLHRGWLEAAVECGFEAADTVDARVPSPRSPEWDATLDGILDECVRTGTTALLVHADAEAMAIVQRCETRGLSVPGDLSVVAYDDEVAGLFSPALTAVRPPRQSIGRAAVQLLAARLAEPQRPTHRVVISPSLSVRDSSAPPRPPA